MTTALTWKTGPVVGALYAAWACLRRPDSAPELATALAGPLDDLRAAFAEERVPAPAFWDHAFPALALGAEDPRRLAEVVLVKAIGHVEAPPRVPRFERALRALRQKAAPLLAAPDVAFLRDAWQRHGPALLTQIGELTEPELLVEQATVIAVAPLSDAGGGLAAAFGNVVVVEATTGEPWPELPQVLRLAWLLAQLQLDLPRYTEAIPAPRRTAIGALAMLPPTLEAARRCRITEAPLDTLLALAGERWLGMSDAGALETLARWWTVYQERRPPFATALQALEQAWPTLAA